MEYSLANLNRNSKLNQLTLTSLINTLNLIGIEVDGISKEKLKNEDFYENIQLLLKIPSNREDLLIEYFFQKELSLVFDFEINNIWEKIKTNYNFLLKQKYYHYQNYSTIFIFSKFPNVLIYGIEVQNFESNFSPFWLQEKLINFGIKPLNKFQDLVNLIFLEWGQFINIQKPFENKDFENKFSLSLIALEKTEIFCDLNNKNLTLPNGTIVLKNNSDKIISILGNIDFQFSGSKMENLILEATLINNKNENILSNFIENQIISKHFKKQFLENLKNSFQRLLTLIEIFSFGSIRSKKYCIKNENFTFGSKKIIKLKKNSFKTFLNLDLINEEIFKKAGLKIVCKTLNDIFLVIPNSRRDLLREIDLLEEYCRFIGYNNFSEILPSKTKFSNKNKNFQTNKFIKQFFINYGFQEILTNPIEDFLENSLFSIQIKNPLNKELSILRNSLLPKFIEICNFNLRSSFNLTNFFEIGRVFKKKNKQILEEEKFTAIFRVPKITNFSDPSLEWFVAIGLIENFFSHFGYYIKKDKIKKNLKFFHPTRSILLKKENTILGIFGQLDSKFLPAISVKKKIFILELNLKHFKDNDLYSIPKIYSEYSKYPIIKKDLSFSINKNINFLNLKKSIKLISTYLKKINFFDFYTNQEFKDLVSIGIRLEFQSKSFTLTSDLIEKELEKIQNLMQINFKAEFR